MIEFLSVNDGETPRIKTAFSAGADLYANVDCTIMPRESKLIPNGVKLNLESITKEEQQCLYIAIVPRSSTPKKGLLIPNSPGTVDLDFPNEIGTLVYNYTDIPVHIKRGESISQLILKPHSTHLLNVPIEDTIRADGFGSTD